MVWEIVGDLQVVTDLGTLSRIVNTMNPSEINDEGRIVGTSRKKNGIEGPSWLYQDGTYYELESLVVNPERLPEVNYSGTLSPAGINNLGWICGYGFVAVPVAEP